MIVANNRVLMAEEFITHGGFISPGAWYIVGGTKEDSR
jgi:hypothetical protein